MTNITIREFIRRFDNGDFAATNRDAQFDAGWYDWFCKDSAIAGKTRTLGSKVKKIVALLDIDLDQTYVFFKNNCPVNGSLFDSFSICDINTNDVMYWVAPKLGYNSSRGKATIHSFVTNEKLGAAAERTFSNWSELLASLKPIKTK